MQRPLTGPMYNFLSEASYSLRIIYKYVHGPMPSQDSGCSKSGHRHSEYGLIESWEMTYLYSIDIKRIKNKHPSNSR